MTEQLPTKTILFASLVMLAGCEPPEQKWHTDQTLRREIFMQCLEKAPAGPEVTKYNDWSEVVDECGDQADAMATVGKYHVHTKRVER